MLATALRPHNRNETSISDACATSLMERPFEGLPGAVTSMSKQRGALQPRIEFADAHQLGTSLTIVTGRTDSRPNCARLTARRVCLFLNFALVLQKYKVLRISQAGQFNPPHLTRIKKDSLGSAFAVEGDVLIHGPNLVA
jgi:hypothetical protein